MSKTTGRIILVVILLVPAIWALLWKNTKFTYKELPIYTSDEMGDTIPLTIDTFTLIDQHGQCFTRDSIKGKVFISNFFFASCPDVCPAMNKNVKIATEKLVNSTDVMFLSHTVDPYNDTVEVLSKYAKDIQANYDQWKFLTGKKSTIYRLAAESYKGAITDLPASADFIHSEKLVLVDREFRIRGIYEGRDFQSVLDLIEDARLLLKMYKDKEKNEG